MFKISKRLRNMSKTICPKPPSEALGVQRKWGQWPQMLSDVEQVVMLKFPEHAEVVADKDGHKKSAYGIEAVGAFFIFGCAEMGQGREIISCRHPRSPLQPSA